MNLPSRYWFIVPAAGIGQRMQADVPKQYLHLADSCVLEKTLTVLLSIKQVAGIIVALHPDDDHWPTLNIATHEKIQTVIGGAERSHSVLAALDAMRDFTDDNDWVLVHDAARPCVAPENIQHMITSLNSDPVGGILAIPASDTLKQVSQPPAIEATLDRTHIWQAQTPQMFRNHLLRDSLQQALEKSQEITDEASAIEWMGYVPKVVEGRRDNIKITHPDDLWLAEMILQRVM